MGKELAMPATATMRIDVKEAGKLVSQFSRKEQLELAAYLDELTLGDRLKGFTRRKKHVPLSAEDVRREVETVRKLRYAS
jgi:hypothetical protein